MIEQNPIAGEDAVGFAVINGVPMRGALGGGVRGAGVEGGGFRLGWRRGSEHFRRPGLVVFDMRAAGGGDVGSNGLEEAEGAGGDDVGSVIRDLEGDGDVGLGGEVVNLVGENNVEPTAEGGCVGEVGVVELHSSLVGVVRVDVDVVDALGVEVG